MLFCVLGQYVLDLYEGQIQAFSANNILLLHSVLLMPKSLLIAYFLIYLFYNLILLIMTWVQGMLLANIQNSFNFAENHYDYVRFLNYPL